MDVPVEMSSSSRPKSCVDVYGEFSYAYHPMPPKPTYLRTKPKMKTMAKILALVLDRFEEVINLKLQKKPKDLWEASYARMLNHKGDLKSPVINLWNCDLP